MAEENTNTPATEPEAPERLLISADEVAQLLSLSTSALYQFLSAGRLPEPVRLGRCVRWNLEELRAWVNAGCPPRHRWEAVRGDLGFGLSAGKAQAKAGRR